MDIDKTVSNIGTVVKSGKVVAKYVSNSSLTKLAKDSIFQFPVIISASIDNKYKYMAKSLHRFFGGNLCVELLVIQALGMLPKYCWKDWGNLNTEDMTPLVWLYMASMARQE